MLPSHEHRLNASMSSSSPGSMSASSNTTTGSVSTSTRERIVDASAELVRRQGYAATGLKQILAEAQAPFGSLYHHFPGGKEQLGANAIRTAGKRYELLIPAVFGPAPDLVTGVRMFFAGAADHLRETD